MIRLDGSSLDLDGLARIAVQAERVGIAEPAKQRIAEGAAAAERWAAEGKAAYGVNTGLGGNVAQRLDPAEAGDFQRRLIRGRVIGVGPLLPAAVVRGAMAIRLNGLCRGSSGASPAVAEALTAHLNAQLHPPIPARGSIGAGDLGLLGHLALALIGEGVIEHRGDLVPATVALQRAGLRPVELGPKDGIALLNANAVTLSRAGLLLRDLAGLERLSLAAAALAFEGYAANPQVLDPRIAAARPAPGQAETAERMLALLAGGSLLSGEPRRLQDPLGFRCIASVHGSTAKALADLAQAVVQEINASPDNPVVTPDGAVLSTGNFHVPHLALGFDAAAIAIHHAASLAVARIVQMMSGERAGLPRYLSPVGGVSAGFVPLQKTAVALLGEIRHCANPASLDWLPVSDGVEDHATQLPLCVAKAETSLARWRELVAIELLVAAQAVDLRKPAALGTGTARLFEAVRAAVAFLDEDRPIGPDIDRLIGLIEAGNLANLS